MFDRLVKAPKFESNSVFEELRNFFRSHWNQPDKPKFEHVYFLIRGANDSGPFSKVGVCFELKIFYTGHGTHRLTESAA
jgi:hypothetical protein